MPTGCFDGLILVDNTLWSGAVIDPDAVDPDTEAIRRFNDHVAVDARTRQVIVLIGDGLTLIRRAGRTERVGFVAAGRVRAWPDRT